MEDYIIECEECEEISYAATYVKPNFCPICGRRAEIEKRSIEVDSWVSDDGD
jgi:rRNA maturation endonuclease Nob1